MKARDLLFIAIVLVAVGGLYFLSTRGRVRPLPGDPTHAAARTRADCLGCHLPKTLAALEQAHKHPGKWRDERVSCLLCHTAPPAKTTASRDFRFGQMDKPQPASAQSAHPASRLSYFRFPIH
jgi:hypothetical protein